MLVCVAGAHVACITLTAEFRVVINAMRTQATHVVA